MTKITDGVNVFLAIKIDSTMLVDLAKLKSVYPTDISIAPAEGGNYISGALRSRNKFYSDKTQVFRFEGETNWILLYTLDSREMIDLSRSKVVPETEFYSDYKLYTPFYVHADFEEN